MVYKITISYIVYDGQKYVDPEGIREITKILAKMEKHDTLQITQERYN